MSKFKTQVDLADWVYDMHLQNTNGRESHDEMFRLGIKVCLEELEDLKLFSIPDTIDQKISVCPRCKSKYVYYWINEKTFECDDCNKQWNTQL